MGERKKDRPTHEVQVGGLCLGLEALEQSVGIAEGPMWFRNVIGLSCRILALLNFGSLSPSKMRLHD